MTHSLRQWAGQALCKLSQQLIGNDPKVLHPTIWQFWDQYLSSHTGYLSSRSKHYETRLLLERFELFEQHTHTFFPLNPTFRLSLDDANGALIEAVWNFARHEIEYVHQYPDLYEQIMQQVSHRTRIGQRCDNTATQFAKHFRTFLNWCMNTGRTNNRAFRAYTIKGERYHAPFYLTIQERNQIRDHQFHSKSASRIRDIFLFQCLTGERFSDLSRLTHDNLTTIEVLSPSGQLESLPAISFIAQKTSRERDTRPIIIPLLGLAKTLVDRYQHVDPSGRLFPVPSLTYYNLVIKKILKECGITRHIELQDRITGQLTSIPIYQLAGSHIARRTCIGSMFKQGVNREIIASISGHSKGSKAIGRYYEVDTEQKKAAMLSIL